MMFKSGELGGQFSNREGDETCLTSQYSTTCLAGAWVGSLSCCSTQLEMPLAENIFSPQGRKVCCKTCLYSWVVMFLDLSPFLFVYMDFCCEVPVTKWHLVTPCHEMPAYTFTHMGWFTAYALGLHPLLPHCTVLTWAPGCLKRNFFLSVNMTRVQSLCLFALQNATLFSLVSFLMSWAGLPL